MITKSIDYKQKTSARTDQFNFFLHKWLLWYSNPQRANSIRLYNWLWHNNLVRANKLYHLCLICILTKRDAIHDILNHKYTIFPMNVLIITHLAILFLRPHKYLIYIRITKSSFNLIRMFDSEIIVWVSTSPSTDLLTIYVFIDNSLMSFPKQICIYKLNAYNRKSIRMTIL